MKTCPLRPLYRGPTTRCPGCTRSNWLVGRFSAECAFCNTALALAPIIIGEAR